MSRNRDTQRREWNRLGQVRNRRQAGAIVVAEITASDDDGGNTRKRRRLQLKFANPETVNSRHIHVEQDEREARVLPRECCTCLATRGGKHGDVPFVFDDLSENGSDRWVVVDDQDMTWSTVIHRIG